MSYKERMEGLREAGEARNADRALAPLEAEIERLRSGIAQLYLSLSVAKEKLGYYREEHGNCRWGADIDHIIEDLADKQIMAIRLQNK